MSKQVPEFIHPFRAAEGRHSIAGPLSFARMPRLNKVVENPAGSATVTLEFGVDEQGLPCVHGSIDSDVVLICQRCLEPMTLPISIEMDLGIVGSDDEAKRLPAHYDPLIAGPNPVSLAELIEDEMLLALPAIPRHEEGKCVVADAGQDVEDTAQGNSNPFAVLAKLKSKN